MIKFIIIFPIHPVLLEGLNQVDACGISTMEADTQFWSENLQRRYCVILVYVCIVCVCTHGYAIYKMTPPQSS